MGRLDDPLNTFWQLFTLAPSSSRWQLATPPGVASNGGLVVSAAGGGPAVAGFLPSQALEFSPLAASTDQGTTWSTGLLPGALAPVPDSLAVSGAGQYLALVRSGSDSSALGSSGGVVADAGGLDAWSAVVATRGLSADPSTAGCGIGRLTAVAFGTRGAAVDGSDAIVGAECLHGRRAGILEHVGDRWMVVGPPLAVGAAGPTAVLRLADSAVGISALVSVGSGSSARLVALWGSGATSGWRVSAPLALNGEVLTSTGVTASGGFVVAASDAGRIRTVAAVEPPAGSWQRLTTSPTGTTAVVPTPGGGFDAFEPEQSTLVVDTLGSDGWHRIQSITVPIQYGSSD